LVITDDVEGEKFKALWHWVRLFGKRGQTNQRKWLTGGIWKMEFLKGIPIAF